MKKVLILDTSVICVWLQVPGKDTCGRSGNILTHDMVKAKIESEQELGTTFVLPIASVIETGNHIAHIRQFRGEEDNRFSNEEYEV